MSIGLVLLLAWCGGTAAQLTAEQQRFLLDQHNIFRCMSKVPLLTWDAGLAASAQEYANLGQYKHSDNANAGKVGENLAYRYPMEQSTPQLAVKDWYAEIQHTNPFGVARSYSTTTGHYTSMMWKATTRVGCGVGTTVQQGQTAKLWVCLYMEVPNVPGQYTEMVVPPTVSPQKCGGADTDVPGNFPTLTGTPDADKIPSFALNQQLAIAPAPAAVDAAGLAIAPAPGLAANVVSPAPVETDAAPVVAPVPAVPGQGGQPAGGGVLPGQGGQLADGGILPGQVGQLTGGGILPGQAGQLAGGGVLPGQGGVVPVIPVVEVAPVVAVGPAASMPNEIGAANILAMKTLKTGLVGNFEQEQEVPLESTRESIWSLAGATMTAFVLVVFVVGMNQWRRRPRAALVEGEQVPDEELSLNEI